ncbi:MAG TPA: NAD(+) synthase [Candidatus Eisenbacteria bacterium]|nr:NAD(+) synthase [Candidatus Eisenbacteria bacterium]
MNDVAFDPLGAADTWRGQMAEARRRLVVEIKAEVEARGHPRIALGLSGGLDSAVAAALCVEALGADNVLAVLMPLRTTDPSSVSLAQGLVNSLGLTSRRVNMSPVVDSYFANFPDANRNRRGLAVAWARVGTLLDLGSHYGASVVQALNRTDTALHYGEAQQELLASVKPLAGLWKTQVQLLAESMSLMPDVRRRRPTLEYWAGQSDESDLGYPYAAIDPLLDALLESGLTPAECVAKGFSQGHVAWADKRIARWRLPKHDADGDAAQMEETRP